MDPSIKASPESPWLVGISPFLSASTQLTLKCGEMLFMLLA